MASHGSRISYAGISKPTRPSVRIEFRATSTITVLVGSEEQDFLVHKSLISAYSGFFRAACSGNWRENEEKTVRLPDVRPQHFQPFMQWLYTGHPYDVDKTDDLRCCMLADLYILGDKLEAPIFRNLIIDQLIERIVKHSRRPVRIISAVYEHTPESSPLRRLMVSLYIWDGKASWFTQQTETLTKEFLLDVAIQVSKNKFNLQNHQAPYITNVAQYYDQGEPVSLTETSQAAPTPDTTLDAANIFHVQGQTPHNSLDLTTHQIYPIVQQSPSHSGPYLSQLTAAPSALGSRTTMSAGRACLGGSIVCTQGSQHARRASC